MINQAGYTCRYKDRKYAMQTFDEPPTIDNYHGHPFLASLETSAADADDAADGSGNDAQQEAQPAAATGTLRWGASPVQRRSFGGGASGGRAASPALRPHRSGSVKLLPLRSRDKAVSPAGLTQAAA